MKKINLMLLLTGIDLFYIGHYDDIPIILTGNAVMYDKGSKNQKRRGGDASELLFDIVTIDKKTRAIHIVRVGAGENRDAEY